MNNCYKKTYQREDDGQVSHEQKKIIYDDYHVL